MTDTLSRLAGPVQPAKTGAGTTIYDPSTGTVLIRNAIINNTHPHLRSWAWLSIGDLTVKANRLISGLMIPPNETIIVPIDTVINGATEDIRARQVCDMKQSNIAVAATIIPAHSDATDSTTYTTASWTSADDEVYVMQVVNTHASNAGLPSSFTDTHTGITWVLLQSVQATEGTIRLSQYLAEGTGASTTTTGITFGATQTGCMAQIVKLVSADLSGTSGNAAVTAAGTGLTPLGAAAATNFVVSGDEVCGGILAGCAVSAFDSPFGVARIPNYLPSGSSGSWHQMSAPNACSLLTFGKSAVPASVIFGVSGTGTAPRLGGLLNVQNPDKYLNFTLDGVVVT